MYVSEFTQFLQQMKRDHPELPAQQAEARAIWWDKKPATPDESERLAESRVRQKAYVYQTGR